MQNIYTWTANLGGSNFLVDIFQGTASAHKMFLSTNAKGCLILDQVLVWLKIDTSSPPSVIFIQPFCSENLRSSYWSWILFRDCKKFVFWKLNENVNGIFSSNNSMCFVHQLKEYCKSKIIYTLTKKTIFVVFTWIFTFETAIENFIGWSL